jgi:hypothetical protein
MLPRGCGHPARSVLGRRGQVRNYLPITKEIEIQKPRIPLIQNPLGLILSQFLLADMPILYLSETLCLRLLGLGQLA